MIYIDISYCDTESDEQTNWACVYYHTHAVIVNIELITLLLAGRALSTMQFI